MRGWTRARVLAKRGTMASAERGKNTAWSGFSAVALSALVTCLVIAGGCSEDAYADNAGSGRYRVESHQVRRGCGAATEALPKDGCIDLFATGQWERGDAISLFDCDFEETLRLPRG